MSPRRLTILCVSQMPASPPRFGAQARVHRVMAALDGYLFYRFRKARWL